MAYSTPWYTDFRGEEIPRDDILNEWELIPRRLAHRDLHLGNVLLGKFRILSLIVLFIDDDCRRFVPRRGGT